MKDFLLCRFLSGFFVKLLLFYETKNAANVDKRVKVVLALHTNMHIMIMAVYIHVLLWMLNSFLFIKHTWNIFMLLLL